MNDRVRVVLAVLAGVFLWGLLWNLGNAAAAALFPDALANVDRIEAPGPLLALLAYSITLSVGTGWLAAVIGRAAVAVLVLGIVNLAIGIVVQISYWEMMPLWYHVLFLACVLPATLAGGRLRGPDRAPRDSDAAS